MIGRYHGRQPKLSDLVDFSDDETFEQWPTFLSRSIEKIHWKQKNKQTKKKKTRRKLKSYVSHAAELMKNKKHESSGDNCPVWGRHDLDNHRQFHNLKLKERNKTLSWKKLCYSYYSPMTAEHNSKSWKGQSKCKVCNLDHPTGLHGCISKKKDGASTNDTEEKEGKKTRRG